jgi:Family of unknown function (DUF6164)
MSSKLMSLRNVPADELDEIYALLDANAIGYYETTAGVFGISLPALWLPDDSQFAQARALLDAYAVQRSQQARASWQAGLEDGSRRTLAHMVREQPLRFVFYTLLIAALIYFSIAPFWLMAR